MQLYQYYGVISPCAARTNASRKTALSYASMMALDFRRLRAIGPLCDCHKRAA